tara:strand:+ start:143 stop:478 length:336 start_codon:yes stop_codon:yes gene_type:complete
LRLRVIDLSNIEDDVLDEIVCAITREACQKGHLFAIEVLIGFELWDLSFLAYTPSSTFLGKPFWMAKPGDGGGVPRMNTVVFWKTFEPKVDPILGTLVAVLANCALMREWG